MPNNTKPKRWGGKRPNAGRKAKAISNPSKIKDRIVGLKRIKASQLIANPKNWRRHPREQEAAMRGILAEIGWSDALLARKTDAGYELIDGHLRAGLAPDQEVPVLLLDLTEEEADKLLLSLDPIAAMGVVDKNRFAELFESVSINDQAVNTMLEALLKDNGTKDAFKNPTQDQINKHQVLKAGEFGRRSTLDVKEYIDLICPECHKSFSLKAGDILKKSTT